MIPIIVRNLRVTLKHRVTLESVLVMLLVFALALALQYAIPQLRPERKWQPFVRAALPAYLTIMLFVTVFNRAQAVREVYMTPFWSYRELFASGDLNVLVQILSNVVLMLPVGFTAVFCTWPKQLKLGWVALGALMFSYLIELLQLVLHYGFFELVDDPLHNLLGAIAGYFLARAVLALHARKRTGAQSTAEISETTQGENTT